MGNVTNIMVIETELTLVYSGLIKNIFILSFLGLPLVNEKRDKNIYFLRHGME